MVFVEIDENNKIISYFTEDGIDHPSLLKYKTLPEGYEVGAIIDPVTEEVITPAQKVREAKEYSRGGFISLFSANEWHDAKTFALTDVIASQFFDILYNSDFIREDDIRLQRGLDYFRINGKLSRTNEEIFA